MSFTTKNTDLIAVVDFPTAIRVFPKTDNIRSLCHLQPELYAKVFIEQPDLGVGIRQYTAVLEDLLEKNLEPTSDFLELMVEENWEDVEESVLEQWWLGVITAETEFQVEFNYYKEKN